MIYNFGYVALNIMQLREEDSGVYTVRAYNKAGECTSQASIKVICKLYHCLCAVTITCT